MQLKEFKNEMCLEEIRVHAQNMITFLGSM